jgi:flagellar basal body-associated protein FliL
MNRGGSRVTLLVTAGAVLLLVGIVAVASTGSTPTGTSEGRRPSDVLLDTFFSLAVLSLIPAAALFIWGLTQRKAVAEEIASGRYPRTSMLAFAVFVAVFTAAIYLVRRNGGLWGLGNQGEVVEVGPDGEIIVRDASAYDENAYQAEFAWIPVLVVVALVAVGVSAYVLAARKRAPLRESEAAAAEDLAAVLDDTLDDLRAEQDPRRAVIAAYARLERALAASGFPRSGPETAEEYVARILGLLEVDKDAIRRLTDLFTRAKFSQHEIDDEMKAQAIDSLVEVRDGLRAAARRDDPEEAPAVGEQAAPS